MEQNLPVMSKRVWSIMKTVVFMMRRGFSSKRKLMVDLNLVLKRGKIASVKAIGNLMSHHQKNHRHLSSSTSSTEAPVVAEKAVQEYYEFSCSNTPNYIFPFNLATKKKNSINSLFECVHAPPTHDEDMATVNAFKAVLEMLTNNDTNNTMMEGGVAASPMLAGFGQTPLARQLRITDSPFPLRDVDEDDSYVDKAAEDFINRFYKDLRQQNKRLSQL